MNLRFQVIWIEDSHSPLEEKIIADGIRRAGFEPHFEVDPSGSRIDELAERQRLFNDFDFLLLDLALADGIRGDELALHIRERFRSTPMLFYSGEPVERLRERMLEKRVEGVFCAHRDDMPRRVGEMVADLSVSLNRLAGMRGLAAEVVAECDDEFRAIIGEACARLDETGLSKFCQEIDKMVEESVASSKASYDKCKEKGVEARLKSRSITSNHLWRLVRRIVKAANSNVKGMGESRLLLAEYDPNVLKPRNSLSHVLEVNGDDGWQLTGHGPGDSITVEDFPLLRRNFIAHVENAKAIRRLLAGKQS